MRVKDVRLKMLDVNIYFCRGIFKRSYQGMNAKMGHRESKAKMNRAGIFSGGIMRYFFILVMLLLPTFTYGDVYKWTDENGVVHFSYSSPDNSGQSFEVIQKKSKQIETNIYSNKIIKNTYPKISNEQISNINYELLSATNINNNSQSSLNYVNNLFETMFLTMMLSIIFSICFLAFWIWMIIDCLHRIPSEDKDKTIWFIVIFFGNGIGALIYFFAGRPKYFTNPVRVESSYNNKKDWTF